MEYEAHECVQNLLISSILFQFKFQIKIIEIINLLFFQNVCIIKLINLSNLSLIKIVTIFGNLRLRQKYNAQSYFKTFMRYCAKI